MKKLTFLLSLSAFFTTVVFAQTPARESVGVITRVDGLVTLAQDNNLGNAANNNVVLQNARVVTTRNGSITIRLNNGCIIDMKPNQALTVDARRDCAALVASIQPAGAMVGTGTGTGTGVGAGSGVGGAVSVGDSIIIGTGALVTLAVIRGFSLQNLSGS